MKRIIAATVTALLASSAQAQFSAGEIAGILLGGGLGGAACSQVGGGTGRTAAIIGCSTVGAIVGQQVTKQPQQPQPQYQGNPNYVFQGNPYSQGYNQPPIVITRGPNYQRNSCQIVTKGWQTATNAVTVATCACWNSQLAQLVEAEMAYCRN